jgi:hypothetical protein
MQQTLHLNRYLGRLCGERNLHSPDPKGILYPQALGEFAKAVFTFFPDFALDEVSIAQGEHGLVVLEWRFSGTNTGRWPGADREPTGKHVSCPGISRIRVQGDKILEERVYLDRLDEFGCWGAKEQKTGFKPAVGGSVGFMPIRKSN